MSAREAYIHRVEPGRSGGPLAFLFHGTGGDERRFLALGRELMPEATLIAPRGDVSENGALRFFRRKAEGVYDMADLARATEKMAGFIEAHAAERGDSRILGMGYSNGANILASVVLARRNLFDAVVLMHPLIPWTPEPGAVRTRVLITAGERDPICPPPLTRGFENWLRSQGAKVETHWTPGGHELARTEIVAAARFLAAAEVAEGESAP